MAACTALGIPLVRRSIVSLRALVQADSPAPAQVNTKGFYRDATP